MIKTIIVKLSLQKRYFSIIDYDGCIGDIAKIILIYNCGKLINFPQVSAKLIEFPLVLNTLQLSSMTDNLSSPFLHVFEGCRDALIEAFHEEETNKDRKKRYDNFERIYANHAVVKGHVDRSTFQITHETGFIPPPSLYYTIKIKSSNASKKKYDDYITIKKSLIGEGDPEVSRKSGYGVFADRVFTKGEYICCFLGEMYIQNEKEDSVYSLDLSNSTGDYYVDPKGSFWNHVYFGMHMMNDPRSKSKVNVHIDENLRVIAKRDIAIGEELFTTYGNKYWKKMSDKL